MRRSPWAWLVLSVTLSGPAFAQSGTRPLTLRRADRAIDLGFYAELAGDYAGARAELSTLIRTATRSEDAPGRARIGRWIQSMDAREAAFARHGKTAPGYVEAFETLERYGPERWDLLWSRAVRDVPGLEVALRSAPVVIREERLRGIGRDSGPAAWLAERLVEQGLEVMATDVRAARYEVRIIVDGATTEQVPAGSRVTVECAYVMRDLGAGQEVVAASAARRAEVRRKEEDARRLALRRVLDDTAQDLMFRLRSWALRTAAAAR